MTTNKQFMEWVEHYLADTIQPEEAKKLLELVQNDPEKLEAFCQQLQVANALKIQQSGTNGAIAEAVLKKIEEKAAPPKVVKFQLHKILLRTAAVLAVVFLGLSISVPHLGGSSKRALETKRRAELARLNADGYKQAGDSASTQFPADFELKYQQPVTQPITPDTIMAPEPASIVTDKEKSSRLETGIAQYKEGNLKKAGEVFDEILKENPSDSDAQLFSKRTAQRMAAADLRKQTGARSAVSVEGLVDYSDSIASSSLVPRNIQSVTAGISRESNTAESYAKVEENGWLLTIDKPLSTFSIDADTASYANIRRFINSGRLPPPDAVRIEEMVNYFEYDYKSPTGKTPFSSAMTLAACPWNRAHQLLRVGLQGREEEVDVDRSSNLVFLMDVSGSMGSADKLPLLKRGFETMINALGENDRVAIVAYAGASGLVLDSTSAAKKETILSAMNRLSAGGSTAGGAGIELAYRVATDNYIKGGINRVILATDGDFNVGVSSHDGLQKLIEKKRESGVFLSVLGFGSGNLKDSTMELLANKGNGNYFYIDSEREAQKVLVKQLRANMIAIAKDVKIQIEFNPACVQSYRLIGYENRKMAARDFADDKKDAGEIGAGHQVTALYELIPVGAPATQDGVELKYGQSETPAPKLSPTDEMLTLKLRYKEPEGETSKLLTFPLEVGAFSDELDTSFRWAAAVAAFGQYLRHSDYLQSYSIEEIYTLAKPAAKNDPNEYRHEFMELLKRAAQLDKDAPTTSKYPPWEYRN